MPYVSYSDTVEIYRRGMEKGQAVGARIAQERMDEALGRIIRQIGPHGHYCIPLWGPMNLYVGCEPANASLPRIVIVDADQLTAIQRLIHPQE